LDCTVVNIINTNIELLLAIASKSEDNGCCYVVEGSCKDYSLQEKKNTQNESSKKSLTNHSNFEFHILYFEMKMGRNIIE